MIYANNAATTWPKPECVYHEVDRAFREAGLSWIRAQSRSAPLGADALAEARSEIARFLGIEGPSRLVFTPGCTYALNQAIQGLPWEPQDVALMSGLEHHAVSRPIRKVARERGIRFEVAPWRPGMPIDLDFVRDILRKGRVRLMACTMASNVTGEVLPVREVGRLAHEYGALLLVDVAQAAGLLPVDVRDLGADLLAFPGHKGLFGPPGVGGLYVASHVTLGMLSEGGTGRDTGRHEMGAVFPASFEVGTHNVPAIRGLSAGVRWLKERGLSWIRNVEQQLTTRFLAGLERLPRVTVYGTKDPAARTSVVSVTMEGLPSRRLSAWLAETHDVTTRAGYHCAPLAHETIGTLPGDGTTRFSFGCFNTLEEVDAVLGCLAEAPRTATPA